MRAWTIHLPPPAPAPAPPPAPRGSVPAAGAAAGRDSAPGQSPGHSHAESQGAAAGPSSGRLSGRLSGRGGRRRGPAGLALVPEGFSLPAALAPMLWLLWHRLWLALVLYLALAVLAGLLLPAPYGPALAILAQLMIGFHAQDIRRWTLARHGRPVAAVVLARDEAAALRRVLDQRPDWRALENGGQAA